MICAPKLGRREIYITETAKRAAIDYARAVRFLCDDMFPEAEKIVVIQDNLNTHTLASLHKAFPLVEARRLAKWIEWHFTPKHGSWLNIAEIEISVLSRSSLKVRIPNVEAFRKLAKDDSKRRNESSQPPSGVEPSLVRQPQGFANPGLEFASPSGLRMPCSCSAQRCS
jgi:hypothetical protein